MSSKESAGPGKLVILGGGVREAAMSANSLGGAGSSIWRRLRLFGRRVRLVHRDEIVVPLLSHRGSKAPEQNDNTSSGKARQKASQKSKVKSQRSKVFPV